VSEPKRFSKTTALQVLDDRASRIAQRERFNRSHGTRQLNPSGAHDELVRRAVEYGRMRAMEEFACAIEEGFRFDAQAETQAERKPKE
jgi:hypothetical protein